MNRQDWYLASLGVVRYLPRGSIVAEQEVPPVAVSPTINAAVTAPARQGRAALAQLMAETPAPVPAAETRPVSVATTPVESTVDGSSVTAEGSGSVPAAPAAVEATDAPPVAFRLAVWQPAPDLLFFDALSPGDQPSATMARLVSNMAAALGRAVEGVSAPQLIDWPPPRGRAVGGLEAARSMASAFCDARVNTSDISLVLLMGSDSVRLLWPSDIEFGQLLCQAGRWREVDAVVTPSLAELLDDPSGKRRVWQAIAPFRRRPH